MTLVLGALVVVGALVAFGVVLARSARRTYAEQHELIPGQPSSAPKEWAGAHTPEARMHRRLGEAIRGVRATAEAMGAGGTAGDARLLEMRVELEQQAVQVDNQLIAAAQLPGPARETRLRQIEQSVAAIETAAADLSALIAGGAASTTHRVQGLADQIQIVGEVQRELDALDGLGPAVEGAVEQEQQDAAQQDDGDARGRGTPGTA